MIRRFNYTGRRRIRKEHAVVSATPAEGGVQSFSVTLSLATYRFPADARVVMEAYRQTSFMRFDWGTVAQLHQPDDRHLTEFNGLDGVRFRLKVVDSRSSDANPAPRILGLADRLVAKQSNKTGEATSLLPIVPADIPEVWRLVFDHDEDPTLEVNESLIDDATEFGRNDAVASLVLPQVYRSVLSKILIADGRSVADADGWRHRWLEMSRRHLKLEDPPHPDCDGKGRILNEEDIHEWIDHAVKRFVTHASVIKSFDRWWNERKEA
jgi:hypothetical protein